MTSREIDHLIGRCLMVGIRGATPDDPILRADLEACRAAHIRGIILFDVDLPTRVALERDGVPREEANRRATRNILNPPQLRDLCAHIKATLGPGTIISIDQEGGRVARLKPERGFRASKSAAELGAMSPDVRRAECAAEAAQLAGLGIDLNFAPCVDLGDRPDNPIITKLDRAFGADPEHVAACARDVIAAHHQHGIVPCLKHFPGHGSTISDSHSYLPDITDTWCERELRPYASIVGSHSDARPLAVMTGHLHHRRMDGELAASLSPSITRGMLRDDLGFRGPIITDSLDMGAIAKRIWPEDGAAMALYAGASLALHAFNSPGDTPQTPHPAPFLCRCIERAVVDGVLTIDHLRASASRMEPVRLFTAS